MWLDMGPQEEGLARRAEPHDFPARREAEQPSLSAVL